MPYVDSSRIYLTGISMGGNLCYSSDFSFHFSRGGYFETNKDGHQGTISLAQRLDYMDPLVLN